MRKNLILYIFIFIVVCNIVIAFDDIINSAPAGTNEASCAGDNGGVASMGESITFNSTFNLQNFSVWVQSILSGTPSGLKAEIWINDSGDNATWRGGTFVKATNMTNAGVSLGGYNNFSFNNITLTQGVEYLFILSSLLENEAGSTRYGCFQASSGNPFTDGIWAEGLDNVYDENTDRDFRVSWYLWLDVDVDPPVISDVCLTSSNPDDCTEPYRTVDTTPTFNFTVSETAECFISDDNTSWIGCTTTNTSGENICTQSSAISVGTTFLDLNCTDTSGNSGYTELETEVYTVSGTLLLDGVGSDRKYEFGTTVNITFNESFCLDILDETDRYLNYSCNANTTYLIDKLLVVEFNDSGKIFNLTNSTNTTAVLIDNRTDLVELDFNITGFVNGTNPENIEIDIGMDQVIDAIIPGRIIGKNYEIYKFIYNNVIYPAFNLTFDTQGEKYIYLNITTTGNTTRSGILNFSVTAFELDAGNRFDKNQNFSMYLNGTEGNLSIDNVSTPNVVFDDFSNNQTFGNGTENFWIYLDPPLYGDDDSYDVGCKSHYEGINQQTITCDDTYTFAGGNHCLISGVQNRPTHTCGSSIYPDLDINLINEISFDSAIYMSSGGTSGTGYIYLDLYGDNENTVRLLDEYSDGRFVYLQQRYYNITLVRIGGETIRVIETNNENGGSSTSDYSIATLTAPIRLVFSSLVQINPGGSDMRWELRNNFNISGMALNKTNGSYSQFNTNWTKELFDAPNNIQRAKITFDEIKHNTSSDTSYWLSNDNGTTWEVVLNDTMNTFDSTGDVLKLKINLNTTNNLTSTIITRYRVQIVPSSGSDLEIYIGGKTVADMDISIGLNENNTPINYTGTDSGIINYNCSGLTCLIPMKFKVNQSAMLQIANMNYTHNPNPLNFTNLTSVETSGNVSILTKFTSGVLQLSALALEFYGSKNISVVGFDSVDTTVRTNKTIQVRYSQFNLSFPSEQTYWQIFPTKRNQSDIEPFGQNSTHGIWRVSSTAYDDPFTIYARYNESVNTCVENMTFSGQNFSNSTTSQKILNITNLDLSNRKVISNYFSNTLCYQESVNDSSDCGGLDNGSYFISSGWYSGIHDGTKLLNEIWLGSDYSSPQTGTPFVLINYSKPSNIIKAIWQTKESTDGITNVTIPDDCLEQTVLQFNVSASTSFVYNFTCYNGTLWHNLRSGAGATNRPTEEAVWWDLGPLTADIFTYTDIKCSNNNLSFIIPYFCFKARCTDCVDTYDFNASCDWIE